MSRVSNAESLARDSGSAIVLSLIATILIMGIAGASSLFLVRMSHASVEETQQLQAFYLAEAGLERAEWEIASETDLGGDGIGNASVDTRTGVFTVTAVDLGGGLYRLKSTGRSGPGETVLQSMVLATLGGSPFPAAALSVVGELPGSSLQIKQGVFGLLATRSFLLDGGNAPAIATTDPETLQEFGAVLVERLAAGDLTSSSLSGTGTTTIDGTELAIQARDEPADFLAKLESFHGSIVAHVAESLLPASESKTLDGKSQSFGSEDQPVNVYFPEDEKVAGGTSLVGHGTLVVARKLEVEEGAKLLWKGDVIIFGNEKSDSEIEVAGTLRVEGNLVVLGQKEKDSKLTLKSDGSIDLTGALTSLSGETSKSKVQLLSGGDLTVEGVISVLGPVAQIEFKDTSDTSITGTLQVGAPKDAEQLLLKFEGDFESHKDDAGIEKGVEALRRLEIDFGLGESESVFTGQKTVQPYGWLLETKS